MKKTEYQFKNVITGKVDYIETEITSSVRRDGQRQPKQKETPECMKAINVRERQKRIRHLIIANFHEDDYFITLTWYRDLRPDELESAKELVKKFLRKLRKEYKSKGMDLKYIGVLERGSKGGLHFHMIVNRMEGIDKLINNLWLHGNVNYKLLYQDGKFRSLADYLGKDCYERWPTRSRNLIKPDVKSRKIKGDKDLLSEVPERKKGYSIVKDSIISGINPFTGRAYLKYAQERIGAEKFKHLDIFVHAAVMKSGRSAWSYRMEYPDKTLRRSGICSETDHGAGLIAIADALARVKRKHVIRIHIDDGWICDTVKRNLPEMVGNEFRTSDGTPVAYQDSWIKIWMAMNGSKVSFEKGNKYKMIMQRKLEERYGKQGKNC
ncbi:MAG: hypothetical protein MJ117_00410 [Lachnospiraceae bacterium]|nr:hypothetical protein [Lachnospiraceae bacterium]